jgi:flagellar basal-body rod protein FlgB
MGYISQRQALIAQNVANADTPGFAPKDLKPFSFELEQQGMTLATPQGVSQTVTNAAHMKLPDPPGATFGSQTKEDSEVRLDGNHVVLEDQMTKLSAARMDYDAAVGFYQQSLSLLKTAMKKPGS